MVSYDFVEELSIVEAPVFDYFTVNGYLKPRGMWYYF